MLRNRGGYTILEVMIFLAISGVILAGAIVAVNGQQNRTEFTQAMRDIDSKLQDSLNDVSTGVSTGNANNAKNCKVLTTIPILKPGPTSPGERFNCLFLGEAIQFSTSSTAYKGIASNGQFITYTVLGRRLMPGPAGQPDVPIDSFHDANPTAMIGTAGVDLSNPYIFENGITTKAIHYTLANGNPTAAGDYTLVGLYTNFNAAQAVVAGSSADAAQSLQTFVYKLPDHTTYDTGAPPASWPSAGYCIDTDNPGDANCPYETSLNKPGSSNGWSVCFDSNNNTGQTALITLNTTADGVNTRLDFNPDASLC